MMKLDLERAGISYCDEDGLYADFHANRHTFISNLAKAGVSPKIAQSIARHNDVNLTLNVYSHMGISEQAAAIRSLASPPVKRPGILTRSTMRTPKSLHTGLLPKLPTLHVNRCHHLAPTLQPRTAGATATTRCPRSS